MSREYTKVSSGLFSSKKFRALSSDFERLVYVFLLISPNGNSAGVFEQPPHRAYPEIGCTEEAYAKAIESLSDSLIDYDEASDTILIRNWLKFNPLTNARHASGAVSQLEKVSCRSLKLQRLQEISQFVEQNSGCWKDPSLPLVKAKIKSLLIAYAEPSALGLGPDHLEDQTKTETNTSREIENSVERASACDVTAADALPDGGEGDGEKPIAVSPALKALVERQQGRRLH